MHCYRPVHLNGRFSTQAQAAALRFRVTVEICSRRSIGRFRRGSQPAWSDLLRR
jgi:hypothetical protein